MGSEVNNAMVIMMREKISIVDLLSSSKITSSLLKSQMFIEHLIHFTFIGSTKNTQFLNYLNEGISLQVFQPMIVTERILKLSLGTSIISFSGAIDVLKKCINVSVNSSSGSKSNICKLISSVVVWLFENTIDTFKLMNDCIEEKNFTDPQTCMSVIAKAHSFLEKLICTKEYEDMNVLGKSLLSGKDLSALQSHMQSFFSMQFDKIKSQDMLISHSLYAELERYLNELIKLASRYLNPPLLISTKPQQIPYKASQLFLQFQILEYMSKSSYQLADVISIFYQNPSALCENCYNLFEYTVHNIITCVNNLELQAFTAFLFIKIPAILRHLEPRYKKVNGEQSLITKICQLIVNDSNIQNLNKKFECNSYTVFVNQCRINNGLDTAQHQQLIALNRCVQLNENSDGLVSKILIMSKKGIDSMKILLSSPSENKEKISQELMQLINLGELQLLLVTLAALDQLDSLLNILLKINKFAERSIEGNKEVLSDVRADMFNNTFVLLGYIELLFGNQIFKEVKHYEDAFFLTWRRNCKLVTSHKHYTQSVFDEMLEHLLSPNNTLITNNAQWDEYCCCAGIILRELTHAHLRRHITTEVLQIVCEGFKNKRPALCICAIVWLCTQYRTMPSSERVRTVKIIKLLKRPLSNNINSARTAILIPILNMYSSQLDEVLQFDPPKGTPAPTELPKSGASLFLSIVSDATGRTDGGHVHIDLEIIGKFRECFLIMGPNQFAKAIIMLILDSGNEDDIILNETLSLCLFLLEPIKLLEVVFKELLCSFFNSKYLADPHGLSLARCLGKVFGITLFLSETKLSESKMREAVRPAKLAKSEDCDVSQKDLLIQSFEYLLHAILSHLMNKEASATSVFIMNLLDQIAMATSGLHQSVSIEQNVVSKLLENTPSKLSREMLSLLCDLSTTQGFEIASTYFLKNTMITV
ncbi:mediator of RNA polymerase II transcription subunit 24 [Hydra vulgaris]|uniref:mediator of RNA polymerase II transcription subunit 24 n=1 Tax=Hydra vulgaris TaxID=6087 RepID=UPI001F5F044A|nr:mediator of RNA polymerase II transcription subunit 24 isoform X1 [Hydra vulgaris]